MRLASNAVGDPPPPAPSLARRLAQVAAAGGGGMGVASALLTGVFIGEVVLAHRTIPVAEEPPPSCDGRYGGQHEPPPLRLAVLGDSLAAGYGVTAPRYTFGALLATGVVEQLHRPVRLRCLAMVGAISQDLLTQANQAVNDPPDIAVIVAGSNDITHGIPTSSAVRQLGEAVRLLRGAGAEVIVGTCPDLGTVSAIRPPLRWLVRRWSRQMAAAQTMAVVAADGRTVSLGDLLGPLFEAKPDLMFSVDRFHPSAEGYAAAAAAVLPSVLAATVAVPPLPAALAACGEGVTSLRRAAVRATRRPGTEVSQAQENSGEQPPICRLARLRHRIWRRTQDPTEPAPDSAERTPDLGERAQHPPERVPRRTGTSWHTIELSGRTATPATDSDDPSRHNASTLAPVE